MSPDKAHNDTIILAFTGASGAVYGLRLLECLLRADKSVYLVFSKAAMMVFATETSLDLPARPDDIQAFFIRHYAARAEQIQVFSRDDWMSPIASGSHIARAMVVCPCTSGTLASIAAGLSDNLIERAADVMLKEHRQLILVPREMPFSAIHLENMLKLARLGVTIMPPNPGFYQHPTSINDLIDFVVARILDHLHVPHQLLPRWGDNPSTEE